MGSALNEDDASLVLADGSGIEKAQEFTYVTGLQIVL